MDYAALGAGLGSVVAAVGAVLGGIYTGRNSRKSDESKAKLAFETFKFEREKAEEIAAKSRIEAIAEDAALARRRLRETEDEYGKRLHETQQFAQRGWDLARYHFGLLATVTHLMNNIAHIVENEGPAETVVSVCRTQLLRMKGVVIPKSLEEPLQPVVSPDQRK